MQTNTNAKQKCKPKEMQKKRNIACAQEGAKNECKYANAKIQMQIQIQLQMQLYIQMQIQKYKSKNQCVKGGDKRRQAVT